MQKIGFIGFGLIGGSLAKVWRKKHPDYLFVAYNYKRSVDEELLKAKDDGGGFFNSIFGSDSDTHAKEAPALVAASTGGSAINISFNGDFLLNSNNGKFDLESFKAQITRGVKEALKRDEFNSANTEIREQR